MAMESSITSSTNNLVSANDGAVGRNGDEIKNNNFLIPPSSSSLASLDNDRKTNYCDDDDNDDDDYDDDYEDTSNTEEDVATGKGYTSSSCMTTIPPLAGQNHANKTTNIIGDNVKDISSGNNNDDNNNNSKSSEWLTYWTCDVCNTAQFESYDAAVEHEKTCQGGGGVLREDRVVQDENARRLPQDQASSGTGGGLELLATNKTNNTKPNNRRRSTTSFVMNSNNAKVLFSPILSDSSDSILYNQISHYHRSILQSLQLVYYPSCTTMFKLSEGGRMVSHGDFYCLHCSQKLLLPNQDGNSNNNNNARSWSMNSIVNELPSILLSHQSLVCNPPRKNERGVVEGMMVSSTVTVPSSERDAFRNFLYTFFAENGILLLPHQEGGGGGMAVISDDDFMNYYPQANKSKRGRQLLFGSTKAGVEKKRKSPSVDNIKAPPEPASSSGKSSRKHTATSRNSSSSNASKKSLLVRTRSNHAQIKYGSMGCKLHNEYGQYFLVAPLDGIPFFSSFSKEEKKKLHPAEILLLQQLELFTISSELLSLTKKKLEPSSSSQAVVGIRCRNCIADQEGCCFMKVSSIDELSNNVRLMAREHVLMGCPFVGRKDLKVLLEVNDCDDLDDTRLGRYCTWLAKLYSLEDLVNNNDDDDDDDQQQKEETNVRMDSGVVWGESRKLPLEICYPSDVDVSFCVESSS